MIVAVTAGSEPTFTVGVPLSVTALPTFTVGVFTTFTLAGLGIGIPMFAAGLGAAWLDCAFSDAADMANTKKATVMTAKFNLRKAVLRLTPGALPPSRLTVLSFRFSP